MPILIQFNSLDYVPVEVYPEYFFYIPIFPQMFCSSRFPSLKTMTAQLANVS